MVATLATVLGRPIRYIDVPEQTAREWMTTSGMDARLAGALVETMTALRADRFARIADTVPRLTGQPARNYHAWCRDHADLFQPAGRNTPNLEVRNASPPTNQPRVGPACRRSIAPTTWQAGSLCLRA
jgi:hypothetical protein